MAKCSDGTFYATVLVDVHGEETVLYNGSKEAQMQRAFDSNGALQQSYEDQGKPFTVWGFNQGGDVSVDRVEKRHYLNGGSIDRSGKGLKGEYEVLECRHYSSETPTDEPVQVGVLVRQCSCGNMAASNTMVNDQCIPCQQQKKEQQEETIKSNAPFQAHDVVQFIPMYAEEHIRPGRSHALILNCINYGTQESPNWACDVQYLNNGEESALVLMPVQAYMVASWQIKKVNRPWVRVEKKKAHISRR